MSLECRRRTRKLIHFINYINDDCIVGNEKNMIVMIIVYTQQHNTHYTFHSSFSHSPVCREGKGRPKWGNEEVWKPLKKCPPNRETHDWKIPLQINSDANNAQKGNKIVATFNSNNKDSNSDDKTPKATYRIQYSFDYPSLVMQHFYLFVHSSYCRCRAWRILEAPLYCILTYIV